MHNNDKYNNLIIMDNSDTFDKYFSYLQNERRYSGQTIATYRNALTLLLRWKFHNQEIDFSSISHRDLQDFIIEQQNCHKRSSLNIYASAIRSFFQFLVYNNIISQDPSIDLITPKLQKTLPKIFTISQIKNLLAAPIQAFHRHEISHEIAIRDTMILELFYGAGIRISELRNIKINDIDFDNNILTVIGKRNKERLCPFSSAAHNAIKNYIELKNITSNKLLEHDGMLLTARDIQYRLKFYLKKTGLPHDLSPHKIRHSYATHLLNAGADLRLLQELLGHENLSTTQIYTHIDSSHMKSVYNGCHPRA